MHASCRSFRLVLLAFVLLVGCSSGGGGDDGGNRPDDGSLDGVTLSTTTPRSLERVELSGLPPARRAGGDPRVVLVGVDGARPIPVETDGDGHFFRAPFHPADPTTGGQIVVQVDLDGATSPEFTLELSALDDAPGAFAALASGLAAHVDGFAQRRGSSLEALKTLAFDETPAALLPLKYAASFVDDPENPNSLVALANGSSDLLDATGVRLLDQICGHTGFADLVGLEVDALEELDLPRLGFESGLARRDCIDAGISISNADQLSAAMWEAKFAEIAISGDAGNTLTAIGTTFAAGATIPGFGLPFTVLGGATAAWQASRGALAGLNPSSFVSITADADKQRFDEDTEDVGNYSNVRVVATSKGWSADQAVVDAVITALGAFASTAQAAEFTAVSFLQDAAVATVNQGASTYVGNQPGGVIEFCSRQWSVDISSSAWCEARAVFGRFQVASGAQTYEPLEVGEDFLSISARPEKFGQETIDVDIAIGVDAIEVIATPSSITVSEPGDVVSITATLQFAENEALFWDAGAGTWDDGMPEPTNGPGTRPLKTPTSRDAYPFVVSIESLSRQGLRVSGTPVREAVVAVRLDEPIVVTPANACVDPGGSEQFEALQDELPADVTWSLEDPAGGPSTFGTISSVGIYSAPSSGSGDVVVVATSVDDAENRGVALVEVGSCQCFWALSIQGEGGWSGTYAAHGFPSTFGFFSLAIGTDSGSGAGSLNAFADAVAEDQVGTFTPENFGFQIGDRSWVATSDSQDGTEVTLTIVENTGDVVQGSVSGTCVTFVGGEEFFRSFDLNFRSGNLASEESICGEQ